MIANSKSIVEADCSPSERRSSRRYLVEMLASSIAYFILLAISVHYVDHADGVAKVALSLLPVAGIAGMSLAFVRFTLRLDDFQRQTIFLSGAIAALASAVVSMTLGFLENAGLPRISLTWVWPLILGFFGIALPFVRRRYR
jgi:hypothetical protein